MYIYGRLYKPRSVYLYKRNKLKYEIGPKCLICRRRIPRRTPNNLDSGNIAHLRNLSSAHTPAPPSPSQKKKG